MTRLLQHKPGWCPNGCGKKVIFMGQWNYENGKVVRYKCMECGKKWPSKEAANRDFDKS